MNGTTNKVLLIGNLGDDVKLHYFDEQNSIGRFPIATTESYISRTGERITETEWHNIVTRNKLAELCDRYLKKGDKVFVEGRIKTRKWDDNGQTRYTTEIVANSIEFLTPKVENEIKGKVITEFTIYKDGEIGNFKIIEDVGFNDSIA